MPFNQGHALLIGVGTHQSAPSEYNDDIAVRDAVGVSKVLQDARLCGYPKAQVTSVLREEATKAGILSALDELSKRVKKEDTVFVFYTGHGMRDRDRQFCLVSYDAKMELVDGADKVVQGTGVSELELMAMLKTINAKRVMLVFNACFSGELSPTFGPDQKIPKAPQTEMLPQESAYALLNTGQGRVIITACRENQRSYFIKEAETSFFTQALIEGLKGQNIAPKGKYISAFDLYDSLYGNVTKKAKAALGVTQEPEFTMLKGVGSFAVSLYKYKKDKQAGSYGGEADFLDDRAEPASPGVRQVEESRSQEVFDQRVKQFGGVNLGQGNTIDIKGSVVVNQGLSPSEVAELVTLILERIQTLIQQPPQPTPTPTTTQSNVNQPPQQTPTSTANTNKASNLPEMDNIKLKLYNLLVGPSFGLQEIRLISEFHLQIQYDHLGGDNQKLKAMSLIRECEKNGRLLELQEAMRAVHPNLDI